MIEDINITNKSPEFDKAFNVLNDSSDNLFITGKAGTGKSTFLEYLKTHTKKKIAVLAPTGVSALNIKGQTIHSFFKFKPRLLTRDSIKAKRDNRIYKKLQMLVIDEISMVRADVFDAIEYFLRINGPEVGKPFGGVQICVIGDLFQLPPIVSFAEKEVFYNMYENPFFFASEAFNMANFGVVEFNEVYRQSEEYFVRLLNRVRIGDVNQKIIDFVNNRCAFSFENEKKLSVTLTTTNKIADQINLQRLQKISSEEFCYEGKIIGDFLLKEDKLPAPLNLKLKVGSQVMFTRNDPKKKWVNGTIGTVTRLSENRIIVEVEDANGKLSHEVKKEVWESVEYSYDNASDKVKEEVKGEYLQYPIITAWAITIHKSQGKTLDDVVIDLGYGAFASGQLYVALSRCRKFEKIILKRPITYKDVRCDYNVVKFSRGFVGN